MSYMIKYDSTHGRLDGTVSSSGNKLVINGHEISTYDHKCVTSWLCSTLPQSPEALAQAA